MKRNAKLIAAGLGVSLVLAFFLSPLASSLPDGLEKVIEKLVPGGEKEVGYPRSAPFPDYAIPGVGNERLSTGLAGVMGTVLVFAAAFFVGRALRRRESSSQGEGEGD